MAIRVWSKARAPFCAAWEREHLRPYHHGGEDGACDRAGWFQALLSAHAVRRGQAVGTVMADLDKFYERVPHEALRAEGAAVGCTPRLVEFTLASYSARRTVEAGGMVCAAFREGGSVIAGCSLATTMARVLLLRLLDRVVEAHPPYTSGRWWTIWRS